MRSLLFAALTVVAIATAAAAEAAITVIGPGPARSCYVMALQGRDDLRALDACDVALNEQALTTRARAGTLVNRGIIHLNRRDFSLALVDFDHAAGLSPNLAEAYTNRGIALTGLGDFRSAVDAITQGLSLQPEEPEKAYFSRGIANEGIGDIRAAYRDYRRAAELAPNWALVQTELTRFQVRAS